jgi:hypothetical protein
MNTIARWLLMVGAVAVVADAAMADEQVVAKQSVKKVLVDDTVNDAQLKQIRAKGYRPEAQARGNEVYYCRSEHELGSRFEKKVCKTAAHILQDEQNGKELGTSVERPGEQRATDK